MKSLRVVTDKGYVWG